MVARRLALALLGVVGVTLAARVSVPIPGSPVPQSLQTLAVCLVGAGLGARWGGVSVLLYLAAGAFGLPAFADGAAGWRHLTGPTAGYLVGFVGAAWLVGFGVERMHRHSFAARLALFCLLMLAAHAVILGLGWLRLGALTGWGEAWRVGVAPFVWGGVVKSVVGGAVVAQLRPITAGRSNSRVSASDGPPL